MKIHEIICDKCGKKQSLVWNREHWIAPDGWMAIYDDHRSYSLEIHLCPECHPIKSKSKVKP